MTTNKITVEIAPRSAWLALPNWQAGIRPRFARQHHATWQAALAAVRAELPDAEIEVLDLNGEPLDVGEVRS